MFEDSLCFSVFLTLSKSCSAKWDSQIENALSAAASKSFEKSLCDENLLADYSKRLSGILFFLTGFPDLVGCGKGPSFVLAATLL